MTPGNIARPPRPITCCCRGFVAIISPNRTDWRIRMQRMSSTCCCIQIIVYVAKCFYKKYLRKLIRKPFESNIETYKQFCIIWCMNICTPVSMLHVYQRNFTGMFPVGDTSSGTLMPYVCVCVSQSVSQSVSLSADISLYCAKNDLTDYPEIVWVCWV